MKDNMENKLDDLFDSNNKKTKKLLWRAKVKSIVIIVIITSIILSAIYAVGSPYVLNKVLYSINMKLLDKTQVVTADVNSEFEVMHPNRFLGKFSDEEGSLSRNIKYDTYKILGSKIVPTEPVERSLDLVGISNTSTEQTETVGKTEKGVTTVVPESLHDQLKNKEFFNFLGQRRMLFFYPFSDYKDLYRNDIENLDQVDGKKLAEMAVSFDKYYSLKEVEDMIPKGLSINWFWIDTLSGEEKNKILEEDEADTKRIREGYDGKRKNGLFRRIVSEESAIGMKAIDQDGYKIDDPIYQLAFSLATSDYNNDKLKYFKKEFNARREEDGKIKYNADCIKIGGVVVTGSIDELKALKNVPNIKASTFGVITDKY